MVLVRMICVALTYKRYKDQRQVEGHIRLVTFRSRFVAAKEIHHTQWKTHIVWHPGIITAGAGLHVSSDIFSMIHSDHLSFQCRRIGILHRKYNPEVLN